MSLSATQADILEKRQNKPTILHKPAYGVKFEYNPNVFHHQFCEEMKDVLMLQFLISQGEYKAEFTLVSAIDEPKSDVDRALHSLEMITNMLGPELFKNVTKSWVEQNLQVCEFGAGEEKYTGKKMILKSSVISFGVYFVSAHKLRYNFFLTVPAKVPINQFELLVEELFKTMKFSEPEVVLTPLVGEILKEYFDDNHFFSINYPERFEKVENILPIEAAVGDNVTQNNAECAAEFSFKETEGSTAHGFTIRVVIEKTKIKFADFVELFKLQLTKSRVLLAAVKETPSKISFQSALDFSYDSSDGVSHIKRVGIVSGHAIVISIDHFGTAALEPQKLFNSILRSFKFYGSPQTHVTTLKFAHFDKDFTISYPDHCKVIYCTSNTMVISLNKKAEDTNGLYVQVLDYRKEPRVPSIHEIFHELVTGYQALCTIVYKQEPKETTAYGCDCVVAELLMDGTWFVNPILQSPHTDSKAVIRVVKSPKYVFVFAFINQKAHFNKSWEQYGRLMLDSVQFS